MKARLMFDDRDFAVDPTLLEAIDHPYRRDRQLSETTPPVGERDMIDDLELEHLWEAMALGDGLIYASARTAFLTPLDTVERIRYRRSVLVDCLAHPTVVREIYHLAVQAVSEERTIWRSTFGDRPDMLLQRSISVLEMFVPILRRMRAITAEHADGFESTGFTRFFDTLRRELDDEYFDQIRDHVSQLRFSHGVLMSARLGEYNQGVDYVLRVPRRDRRRRFRFRGIPLIGPTYSYTVPPRDDAGGQALGRLRNRGLHLVANALGQSIDHMLGFFTALRGELGFYLGCLNLYDQLSLRAEPVCLPEPHPIGAQVRSAQALYDPCLAMRLPHRVQGNDLHADGRPMIIITGANQGGKSTFLRSLAVAQLMMQAGMFAPARAFVAGMVTGVFTHYKRPEDATMTSGKFDEELARMGQLSHAIGRGALLICNESFAATNEREGSDIAYEFTQAMNRIGVTVVYVTHLYDLAQRYQRDHGDTTLFLRARRDEDGRRPFRLEEAAPLPTSYGEDLYRRTFTDDAQRPTGSQHPTGAR